VLDAATALAVARRTDAVVNIVLPATDDAADLEAHARLLSAPRGAPATPVDLGAVPRRLDGRVEAELAAIAAVTGGRVLEAAGGTMARAFRQALDEFRASYVLHYTPSGVALDGWHELVVRVNRAGNFDVRARRGYEVGR
jgi:hypothetical protein